jgi:hypothetical protein
VEVKITPRIKALTKAMKGEFHLKIGRSIRRHFIGGKNYIG